MEFLKYPSRGTKGDIALSYTKKIISVSQLEKVLKFLCDGWFLTNFGKNRSISRTRSNFFS